MSENKTPIPSARPTAGITNVWVVIAAAVSLAVSVLVPPEALPRMTTCYFLKITGRPCAGCGMTRAVCALGHGRFHDAFVLNPFSYVFIAAAVAAALFPLAARRRPAPMERLSRMRWLTMGLPAVLAVAMFCFGAARLVGLWKWPVL